MFWQRQLSLEYHRFRFAVLGLLALILLRTWAAAASLPLASPWGSWRLLWLILIAMVMRSEPLERHTFWRTRPIPQGGLLGGKLGFLLLVCGPLPVAAHTYLLWLQGPAPGALPWLATETALMELLFFLIALATALAMRSEGQAVIAMAALWLGIIISPDLLVSVEGLSPMGIRGGMAESRLIFLAVALPALLALVASQALSRNRKPSLRGLLLVGGFCLAATFWLRAHPLPWRLDAAPLHPDPWAEMDALRLHPVSSTDPRLDGVDRPGRPWGRRQVLAAFELDRSLPAGHGLQIRQVRSTLTLDSGQTIRSIQSGGEWFCQGQSEMWAEAGLSLPSVACQPGLAILPILSTQTALDKSLDQQKGHLNLEIQVDLFRGSLVQRRLIEPEAPMVAGCYFRNSEHQTPQTPTVFRRSFPSMLRQHRLPTSTAHLSLPTGPATPGPVIVEARSTGWTRSRVAYFAPVPLPENRATHLESQSDRLASQSLGVLDSAEPPDPRAPRAFPEGTELLCEERFYVDRTTLQVHLDDLSQIEVLER